jgi:hypothetical protein
MPTWGRGVDEMEEQEKEEEEEEGRQPVHDARP